MNLNPFQGCLNPEITEPQTLDLPFEDDQALAKVNSIMKENGTRQVYVFAFEALNNYVYKICQVILQETEMRSYGCIRPGLWQSCLCTDDS